MDCYQYVTQNGTVFRNSPHDWDNISYYDLHSEDVCETEIYSTSEVRELNGDGRFATVLKT